MRRSAVLLVSVLLCAFVLQELPTAAFASSTTETLSFTETDGVTPLANALVGVFFLPFNADSTGAQPQLMGYGTADSSGNITLSLDASMVPANDLGDPGTGVADAFNVVNVAVDASGNLAVDYAVLTLDGTTTSTASAIGNDWTSCSGCASTTLAYVQVHSGYRYVPVLAQNSGNGMESDFTYTYSNSTSIQTEAQVAESIDGAAFSAGGYQFEATDRTTTAPFDVSGGYHRYVWANYKWVEDQYSACLHGGCETWDTWSLDHFAGQVTDYNPNTNSSGQVIGYDDYTVPSYTSGNGNYTLQLTQNNSGWGRTSGQTKEYKFWLGLVNLSITDKASYGSITKENWFYKSGCGSPNIRWLWGHNQDPSTADIVQANCTTKLS